MKFIIGIITTLCVAIAFWQGTWFAVGYIAMRISVVHGHPFEQTVVLAQVLVFGSLAVVGMLVLAILGRSR